MSASQNDEEKDTLHIGDYIILKDALRGLYLSVEGILSEDITAVEGTENLIDSIFCVHLQRQYSASRDLLAFLSGFGGDIKKIEDESAKKYLLALERGRENEKKLNDTYMRKKFGQKCVFGDIIQLYHVKSRKYLVVVPDQLAKDERENTRLSLDATGNAYSWLQIAPRFKIDKEGDRVLNSSELYLKVAERANEFIHTADRNPLPGLNREVNCALESSSWKLSIYQSSTDSSDPSLLLSSQLVYLSDPETRSNLVIGQKQSKSSENNNDDDASLDNSSIATVEPFQNNHDNPDESISMNKSRSKIDESFENNNFMHAFGDIILQPAPSDGMNSNFLWILETPSPLIGGPITWKTELMRLRHLNTGKYLEVVKDAYRDDFGDEVESLKFTAAVTVTAEESSFQIAELNSTTRYLSNTKAVQIGHNGIWFERGEIMEEDGVSYEIRGTKDKSAALSLIINRFDGLSSRAAKTDDNSEGTVEPMDVNSSLSARTFLKKYCSMITIPKSDLVSTIWPEAVRNDLEFFQLVADKTVYFSQGFPISSMNIQLGIDKGDNNLMIQRQSLMREQGLLDHVLSIISKLIPMTEKMETIKANSTKRKRPKVTDEEMTAVAMAQTVLTKCFNIIFYSIIGNQENQMYVADYMPVLLAHLNVQPLAGKCVTEMLSKNMELQETKIGTREIQIFVDKLRSSRMNAMYLQLLQACCSCEGDGVDGNQCKVATMLFSDTNDIIIQLHADFVRTTQTAWQQPSLYIPTNPIPGSPLRGENLITKGLPLLSLAWTTNSIDFSPLGLFGRLSVNIEDLFKIGSEEDRKSSSDPSKKSKSKKRSAQDQKMAVRNYFIAEMFLGAEMCMDRNYIAMHKLDELFPYEVLVTVLKLNISTDLKAAAVRLLMCLHVDRDPQASSKIPCLTRTWSDIKKNPEPQLPYVETSRRFMFGLIQQLISEHVREMAGNRWDELSRHMLRMLRCLAQFNFYGTNERLTDIIAPLISALNRRSVESNDRPPTQQVDKELDVTASLPVTIKPKGAGEETIAVKEDEKQQTDLDMTNDREIVESQPPWYKSCGSAVYNGMVQFYTLNQRAARVMALLDDSNGSDQLKYVVPLRYSKAPIYELETMVEAVDILAFTQRVIEDRNVSLLMRHFYAWESGLDKRSPGELFEIVVVEAEQLTLKTADFDNVMIDTLMYVHTPLVQSTLEVLMAHHCSRKILMENAKNVQLLASHKRERQFKLVDQMLQQLEQNAETQELWGELQTEADQAVNKQTKDIIKELTEMCRVRRTVLEFDEDYAPDVEIQDLFRNLGCFEICMKVLGLLDSVEEEEEGEEEMSEASLNTIHMCLLCNTLLYWYMIENPQNQQQGYEELDFFLDTLDSQINSHLVIKAIFKGNETLMRIVPHAHLSDLVDRIVKDGQSHHYLALHGAIPNVGDKNITENQLEIVKLLTSPGRFQKVSCFMVPVTHPDYQEKLELMKPFLHLKVDVDIDQLPPSLAYHLSFLNVLSGCTVGRLNVTTVEAKVQSVFNYKDIIDSILDPGTILVAKLSMARFLFNALIDVELLIPGLELSPNIWKLLDSFASVLSTSKQEFINLEKLGWLSPQVSRQRIEYIIIIVYIVGGFFSAYFDLSTFVEDTQQDEKIRLKRSHIVHLIVTFFNQIKAIYDLNPAKIPLEVKEHFYDALDALKEQGNKSEDAGGYDDATKSTEDALQPLAAIELDKSVLENAAAAAQSMGLEFGTGARKRDPAEQKLINKFQQFVNMLEEDPSLQYKAENQGVAFISILEKLPFIADPVVSDVRYEVLIKKLVLHIRENIKIVNNRKQMESRISTTSTWIIRAFRTMIENRMGMSIYERDEEGGQEQDIAAAPVVNALNSCGATVLCLDLIADGIDEKLQLEAIRLGVALLFKEGGALEVQGIMNDHLSNTNSELFFKQVKMTLQKLVQWHTWNETIILEEDQEPRPPDDILILRFLQLMCEGHYLPNQDIMREQPHNHASYNLLDDFVGYLNCLSRFPCRTSTVAGIRLSATILEVLQGPCEGNQAHFVLNTELVEILNRLNRAKLVHDCIKDEEIELKKTSIDIFQGLLEGQAEQGAVYERVLSVVHLDIIQIMSKKSLYNAEVDSEEEIILQTECVVLLQMFCNAKPSLYDELGISRNIEDIVGSGTAMIEVVWRGDIHRRFFHVPPICDYLAKSSKDSLVENVDRSNSENKLIDFLSRSHDLYREVKHQQLLTEMKLSGVFSRRNQNRATWITFLLAVVINALFVAEYNLYPGKPAIAPLFDKITTYINIAQVTVAGFTLALWVVLRYPVSYQGLKANGLTDLEAIVMAATEPLTMYYTYYLLISFLGVFVENYFCALLLLDIIVKNSTTRDVLNAIVTPRKQLVMALLLISFVIYIFALFIFFFFPSDIDPHCSTLYDCLKFTLSYGLQNGGGVGDSFVHTTGVRLILDLAFWAIVLIILLNVFLGMIIDTFSSLRAEKNKKILDTTTVCFICGIDKQVFDRASDEPEGFKTHVKIDHNMWNYMYFIFLLWEQDRDDDDGLEQYVRRAIEADEITWFPINKAMRLDAVATKSEILRRDLKESITYTEGKLASKLDEFQEDVSAMLKQLMKTLKQEPEEDSQKFTEEIGTNDDAEDEAAEELSSSIVLSLDDASEANYGANANCERYVFVSVDKISGLQLPEEELRRVSCRFVVVGGESLSLHNSGVDVGSGIVSFDKEYFSPLLSSLSEGDRRIVSIQLVKEDSLQEEQDSNVIASFEIPILDLASPLVIDELLMTEKVFKCEEPDCSGSITLFSKYSAPRGSPSRSSTPHAPSRGSPLPSASKTPSRRKISTPQ